MRQTDRYIAIELGHKKVYRFEFSKTGTVPVEYRTYTRTLCANALALVSSTL